MVSGVMLLICFAVTLLLGWRVDINEFSLNAFYRNRLVRCYLGATRDAAGPQSTELHRVRRQGRPAARVPEGRCLDGPYHIVNCALNLGGSSDLALHTRHSASFTLSPLYCGSCLQVRRSAGQLAGTRLHRHRRFRAPRWRADPRAGGVRLRRRGQPEHGLPHLVGHRLPADAVQRAPRLVVSESHEAADGSPSPHFNLSYLCAELFGGADDKSRFVNVSDGGHFENLAAYELIRRRCKRHRHQRRECDDQLTPSAGWARSFACARSISIARSRLTSTTCEGNGRTGLEQATFAVGDITTAKQHGHPDLHQGGDDRQGRHVRAAVPDRAIRQFPHESTGDQFYGEDQFESYRHLGRDIGYELFGPVAGMTTIRAAAEALRLAQFD